MSDSEELLFGNITDADGNNNDTDGTSYPQHSTTVAIDSDDSDSYNPSHSTNSNNIQRKKSKSKLKSKLKRDKSRKRIKEMAMNETTNNINQTNSIGEINNNNNDNNNNIYSQSPIHSNNNITKKQKKKKKSFSLNGKSKTKNKHHHRISDKDSDDEYAHDSDEYEHDNINNEENINFCNKCKNIIKILINNGHLLSIILSIIVIITLLSCISKNIITIIIFIICYLIYLLECYFNKTWKQMNNKQICDGNVKLLDALRKTPPIIDWSVECYHYQIKNIPITNKKTIVWVHGTSETGHIFEELGFEMKYFKWDWNALEFVQSKNNQKEIVTIILPSGYEGNRIQKSMISKFKHDYNQSIDIDDEKVAIQVNDSYNSEHGDNDIFDYNMPLFIRWNGNISELITEFQNKNILREERKKMITHTNKMIYDYNKWDDISNNYPNFNKYEMVKLNITKEYCLLNDETKCDFNEQKEEFLSLNNKDKFQTFYENINIRGFKNSLTINNQNKKPFWYTIYGYWIYSILLFTIYPRYKSSTMYAIKNWKLIKAISI